MLRASLRRIAGVAFLALMCVIWLGQGTPVARAATAPTVAVSGRLVDKQTGQTYSLRVTTTESQVQHNGYTGIMLTKTVGVPKSVFEGQGLVYTSAGNLAPSSDGSATNNACDGSYSWCASLTLQYTSYQSGNMTCAYVPTNYAVSVLWTRNDRQVFATNGHVREGAQGTNCNGGGVYGHTDNSIGNPGSGIAYYSQNPTPWGGTPVWINESNADQAANAETTLVRGTGSWDFSICVEAFGSGNVVC
jgi:hypothetical protein